MKINVSIAEDHPLLLRGLAELLTTAGYNIVHCTDNGKDLLHSLANKRLFPHVCLIDYQMQHMNGLDVLKHIKINWPSISVIVMTMNDDEEIRTRALSMDADGFILKGFEGQQLFDLIEEVAHSCYRPIYK